MKTWVCGVCGLIVQGENPPDECPDCGAPATEFTEIQIEDQGDDDDIMELGGDDFEEP